VTGAARQYLVVTSAVEFVLALGQGWNLISLPVEPDDPTVAAAFRATAGRGMEARGEFADGTRGGLFSGEVWAWDGASGTYTAVSEVHALTGYWVHSTEASVIVVRGMPPVSTELSLSPGWNLVGPPGEVALPAAPSIVSPIWFWNGTRYESAGHLYPGWGYWLFSTEPFQWLVGW
jgi:hypothetical protein